jgi:CRISPR-associated protein Cas1
MRLLVIRSKAELSVKGKSSLVIKSEKAERERGLRDVDAILIIGGGVKISSSVPPVLSLFNIPLSIVSRGNITIMINPIVTRYNNYRRLQYTLEKTKALEIALGYINAKINGMINILKYHRVEPPAVPEAPLMSNDPEKLERDIRTWESLVSNKLWDSLVKLIKVEQLAELKTRYDFQGRKPRHADPFNKTLSVMYSVLYTLATKALIAAGLDPTYGFLHKTSYSTPLTFDYTEMFKPIAIEATISMINNNGVPELDDDGDLKKEHVNEAIKTLYKYITLKHKDTGKTPYQQIYLKAFCLARYLEGKCRRENLTITWNRALYREQDSKKKSHEALVKNKQD